MPMPVKMELCVTAHAKAPTDTSLEAVRRAVAKALRAEGLYVPADADVKVEGKL